MAGTYSYQGQKSWLGGGSSQRGSRPVCRGGVPMRHQGRELGPAKVLLLLFSIACSCHQCHRVAVCGRRWIGRLGHSKCAREIRPSDPFHRRKVEPAQKTVADRYYRSARHRCCPLPAFAFFLRRLPRALMSVGMAILWLRTVRLPPRLPCDRTQKTHENVY